MSNFYDEMNERIASFGTDYDEQASEYKTKIEQVKQEIEQAENNSVIAVNDNDLTAFTEQQNVISMKKQQLDNLEKGLNSLVNYPAMSVAEHTAIRNELKEHTMSVLAEKYEKILELLDEGAIVLGEFEEVVKEYYATFTRLDGKTHGHEADETGAKYRKFASMDVCALYPKLNEVFRNYSEIHSLRGVLKNKIKNRSFNG